VVNCYRFIAAEEDNHAVARLCRVLQVSRAGYYAWRHRPPSARVRQDAVLTTTIQHIHTTSRGIYGVPRIHAELRQAHQVGCGRKRVARLMRAAGLQGVCRRRRATRTTRRDPAAASGVDLVHRQFRASAPNQLWVADITYVPTWQGFLYLAVILDAFSRKVVGWSMATDLRTELVLNALEMALTQRRPPAGVIHHSDHGGQYTSLAFGRRCREAGVRLSLGSVGDCFDNALAESFFARLETELIDRAGWRTSAEARLAIFDYIETFYNSRRRHSALGYLSPTAYERRYATRTSPPAAAAAAA
jgi:putative transposase